MQVYLCTDWWCSDLCYVATGASNKRPSGSRVGSATAVEAIQAFTCIVTATLGDAHAQAMAQAEQAQAHLSAQEALNALQKLVTQHRGHPAVVSQGGNADWTSMR